MITSLSLGENLVVSSVNHSVVMNSGNNIPSHSKFRGIGADSAVTFIQYNLPTIK